MRARDTSHSACPAPSAAAGMFPSWSRKLRQLPSASPAINTINHDPAEPEHPATFTNFQIHAQVIHFGPFKAYFSPDEPQVFQRSEWAHPVVWNVIATPQRLYWPCRSNAGVQLSLLSVVSYLGKIHPRAFPSTLGPESNQPLSSSIGGLRLLLRFRIGKVSRL